MWDGHLDRIKTGRYRIELKKNDIRPVHNATYFAGQTERQSVARELQKMVQQEVIEPANTKCARPIYFAPKKDGYLRFGMDYRKPNAVTMRDFCQLPRIDECIYSFGETRILSTLDAN